MVTGTRRRTQRVEGAATRRFERASDRSDGPRAPDPPITRPVSGRHSSRADTRLPPLSSLPAGSRGAVRHGGADAQRRRADADLNTVSQRTRCECPHPAAVRRGAAHDHPRASQPQIAVVEDRIGIEVSTDRRGDTRSADCRPHSFAGRTPRRWAECGLLEYQRPGSSTGAGARKRVGRGVSKFSVRTSPSTETVARPTAAVTPTRVRRSVVLVVGIAASRLVASVDIPAATSTQSSPARRRRRADPRADPARTRG